MIEPGTEQTVTYTPGVANHHRFEVDMLCSWPTFPFGDGQVLFMDYGCDVGNIRLKLMRTFGLGC